MSWINKYISYITYERRYSPYTVNYYSKSLHQFREFIGSEPETARRIQIRTWIVQQSEKLNPLSVNRNISVLRSFYRYLKKNSVLPNKNPAECIVNLRSGRRLPRFIEEKLLNDLLDELEFEPGYMGARDKLILEVLYGAGIRAGELIALKVGDYNPYNSIFKVTGKGNKERIVPLYSTLSDEINSYLVLRKAKYPKAQHLFLNNRGKPYCQANLYQLVKKYLSLIIEFDQRSSHVLRHSFATHLLDNGANLMAIKDLLGHETIRATQIYTHVTTDYIMKNYKSAHPKEKREEKK